MVHDSHRIVLVSCPRVGRSWRWQAVAVSVAAAACPDPWESREFPSVWPGLLLHHHWTHPALLISQRPQSVADFDLSSLVSAHRMVMYSAAQCSWQRKLDHGHLFSLNSEFNQLSEPNDQREIKSPRARATAWPLISRYCIRGKRNWLNR